MQRRLAAAAEQDALSLKHKEQPQADLTQSVPGIGQELKETVKTSALVRIETTEHGRRMIAEQSIQMGTGSVYKCIHRNTAAGKFAHVSAFCMLTALAIFMCVCYFFCIFVTAFFCIASCMSCVCICVCVCVFVCMIQSCFARMRSFL